MKAQAAKKKAARKLKKAKSDFERLIETLFPFLPGPDKKNLPPSPQWGLPEQPSPSTKTPKKPQPI